MTTRPSKDIFISHADCDKDIAESLCHLLSTGLNINIHEQVFCSSLPGSGIPAGHDFKEYIKSQIQTPRVVILIISKNYLIRQFCMAELGATWAKSHNAIPFIVPPVTYADMNGVLGNVQVLKINDAEKWNEALEVIKENVNIKFNQNQWERNRDKLVEQMESLVKKQKEVDLVDMKAHKAVQEKLAAANMELTEKEKSIEGMLKMIEELEKLKDKAAVASVKKKLLPADESFKMLIAASRESLEKVSSYVGECVFYYYKGLSHPGSAVGYSDYEDLMRAAAEANHNGYINEGGELKTGHPKIRKALENLDALKCFMNKDKSLSEEYEEKNEEEYDFFSREFWDRNLL